MSVIVILTGQSLNVWRGSTRVLETGWANARQLVGGGTATEMDFEPTNDLNFMDWNDAASLVTQAETTGGQSPIAGIALGLDGTGFDRVYIGSTAIGSTGVGDLRGRGPMVNVYGMLKQFVDLAAAQGDTNPDIYFYHAHGEYDAANGLDATFEASTKAYFQRLQLAAAQALGDPTYRAKIVVTLPAQNKEPTPATDASADIAIKTAFRNLADDSDLQDSIILFGTITHWEVSNSDWVHPTEDAFVLRGEAIGKVIADDIAGTTFAPVRLISVTQTGTTVVAQFSDNIVRDVTTLDATNYLGEDLGGTDGFEYFDNGSAITINSVVYSGDTATLTLASTPTGTAEQQELRVGCQVTANSTGFWPEDTAGAPIRRDMTAWTSDHDATYDNYDWVLQEVASGFPYTYTPPSSGGGGESSSDDDFFLRRRKIARIRQYGRRARARRR